MVRCSDDVSWFPYEVKQELSLRYFTGVGGFGLGAEEGDTGTPAFCDCFGFFFSLLLRCWPFAIALLPMWIV